MTDRAADATQSFEVADEPTADSSAPGGRMLKAVGFAAKHSFSNLKRFEFERAPAKADEVELQVLFCGDEVNEAYDKVEKGDVRFRYVINMASLEVED